MQAGHAGWLPSSWAVVLFPDGPILELVARAAIIYLLLFAVFRVILRRDLGRMRVADVLLLFLIATAVRQGLTGKYYSVGDGLITAVTIIALDLLLDWLAFTSVRAHAILRPDPRLVIRDGRIVYRNARLAFLRRSDVMEALRENGVGSLDEVREAWLESNGKMSVLRRES